jgi:addiction module RelE/StbE family toxin
MRIVLHKDFQKRLKKLSPKIRYAWQSRRDLFLKDSFNPILDNHPLHGEYAGYRSIDVTGDYHALYEPITDDLAHFILIGTHPELYG